MKKQTLTKYLLFAAALLVCLLLTSPVLSFTSRHSVPFATGIPITIVFAAATALLFFGIGEKEKPLSVFPYAVILVLLGLALFTRVSLLPHVTDDFSDYLNIWMQYMLELPGTESLAAEIANYNMPYLYLLFGIAKLVPYAYFMFSLKIFSVLFDFILAYYVMKLVSILKENRMVQIVSFFAALLVPSVIVNSAMWGQCDSVFSAFALGGLYYGLKKKSRLCWAFFALALSFKLQTVFLMPMLIVFLFRKDIRLRDIWVFAAVFVGLLIPAMIAGRSALSCISVYWNQANSYSELSMLAPNVFAWLPQGTKSNIPVTAAGIFIAGSVVLGFLLYLYWRKDRLNTAGMVRASLIFAVMIPFFLPLMHDRYFYLADTVAVVFLISEPKRWYIPALICMASFLCHAAYLFDAIVIPTYVLAFFILTALSLLALNFVLDTESRKELPASR